MDSEMSVFVDTSIQIARIVHSPETKRRIQSRLEEYDRVVTSLVVKQEYKRRLLKEAKYLLSKLDSLRTATALNRHILDHLPPQQQRKRNICLALVQTVDEQDSEEDRTERLQLFLQSLLRDGQEEFDDSVDEILSDSGCACAIQPIERKGQHGQRYEFGTDYCSRADGCEIVDFLQLHSTRLQCLLRHLQSIPEKTRELEAAEEFLLKVISEPTRAAHEDPCLEVGDLIIALESADVPIFYTLNSAESQHLCAALKQTLIVRPKNSEHEDKVHPPPNSTKAAPTGAASQRSAGSAETSGSKNPAASKPSGS